MEGMSTTLYNGLKRSWRRKDYERLNGSGQRRKSRVQFATLGSTRRRRFWRIKITPKLRFFNITSPKSFFTELRDSYVKMMLGFANCRVFNPGYGGGYGNSLGFGVGGPTLKEYDQKVIVEIYKSLMMAQKQLVRRDAARIVWVTHLKYEPKVEPLGGIAGLFAAARGSAKSCVADRLDSLSRREYHAMPFRLWKLPTMSSST
ncbi:hypothetical protein HHK36_012331 [Tetracentron sinense]|uniref:Uncharacterized protein n=1 Tax=Tetracentron sinense TaxID=13715 RepID=A0A834ZA59_TETSI|nr:hypothetical protein HHK36_012331 [Tetracentron sinense]